MHGNSWQNETQHPQISQEGTNSSLGPGASQVGEVQTGINLTMKDQAGNLRLGGFCKSQMILNHATQGQQDEDNGLSKDRAD